MIATAEATEQAAPSAATQGAIISLLQQTVSASRLSLFLSCRLKFFFKYVERLEKPATPALHLGHSVHAALKAWSKARWREKPLSLKQLHDALADAWSKPEQPVDWTGENEEDEKVTAWRLIETYIRECPINEEEKPEAVEVSVGVDLFRYGLPKLIGVIDLVQRRVIYDFKTAGQTPNPEKVVHLNEVQASAYAMLYREVKGTQEAGIEFHHLVKLKNPKLVVTRMGPMSDQQQTRLFHLIEAYQHGLESRDFVPAPSLICSYCEFFTECRLWK